MRYQTRRTVLASLAGLAATATAGRSLAADGTNDAVSDATPSDRSLNWSTRRADPGRTGSVPADAAPNGEYADDGEERWRHVSDGYSRDDGWPPGIGRTNAAPTVADGRLYLTSRAGTSDADYGGLHALDTGTGEVVWSETERGWSGSPLFADGTLYVTDAPYEDDATIHALDPATGEVRWSTGDAYGSTFVGIADGTLYGTRTYTDEGNELAAWSADDGSLEWTASIEDGVNFGDAAVVGDTIYQTHGPWRGDEERPNQVRGLSAADGSTRWRTTLTADGEDPEPRVSAPAVADGTVYVHAGPRTSRDQHERSHRHARRHRVGGRGRDVRVACRRGRLVRHHGTVHRRDDGLLWHAHGHPPRDRSGRRTEHRVRDALHGRGVGRGDRSPFPSRDSQ